MTPFIRLHLCGEGNPDLRADRRSERRPALILLGMAGADPSAEAGAGSRASSPPGVPIEVEMRGRTASGAHSQERRRGGRLSLLSRIPIGEALPPGLPGGAVAESKPRKAARISPQDAPGGNGCCLHTSGLQFAAHSPLSGGETGGSVEALRLRSGLTIRDLADRTGLNRSRVHRICVGKGRPRPRGLALSVPPWMM